MRYFALSDRGRVRSHNEDSCYADGRLFMVADGVGGHQAGEVASRTTVAIMSSALRKVVPSEVEEKVREIARTANRKLLDLAQQDQRLRGMATTLSLVLLLDHLAYVASAGDSRVYLLRDRRLQQITRDHSVVAEMQREGQLTEEEARIHPYRSVITNVIGAEGETYIDFFQVQLRKGDQLLLCTDGLNSMLRDQEIEAIMNISGGPQKICRALVEAANRAGGYDNTTVIVIKV
ncbi:PPM family protein phosphatase [Candidatus Hakubella thermalkaliphila]|uniref:PPM family protein phosphatase n=1 Tax=Candidatus Hakubella thermalkaliphila TaxID=2754717 RepID=A0A6V8P1S0_9ACTN|nr:Stp1/IreP family PP2C-type Ser/Thr phosphatase [Candidatus Hakubella thermalkaliphila]GFP24726.1 PPM family protein phosphatase [Candidatus Hakubella thermalkaliphila]GFP26797.1 PPM family protein phosphatase [Candidatus Hakubella thermalkaliphila]GFP35144.1 PPM family protein phosphatase [Candidatus Hakubella thermalkaliphila]